MNNAPAFNAYQKEHCVKRNNWITSLETSQLICFGRILLRLLCRLFGHPARRTFSRRYENDHYMVFRSTGLVRLQRLASKVLQLGDHSTFDDWSSRLESKLLKAYALLSRLRLEKYCRRFEASSSDNTRRSHRVVDVPLVPMCRFLSRNRTNAHG